MSDAALTAPLPASLLAKWFVARGSGDPEQDLSNLKLQKLLYLAHSRFLFRHGVPLIKESIQAWDHGPVVGTLYRECSSFGDSPIAMDLAQDGPWTRLSADVEDVLSATWESFAGFSAWRLREITHDLGPWKAVHVPGVKNLTIPTEDIGMAWPEFATLTEVPPGAPNADALARYRALRKDIPLGKRRGDPTALLSQVDDSQGLRHEAERLLG